jgi:hypothetical protein
LRKQRQPALRSSYDGNPGVDIYICCPTDETGEVMRIIFDFVLTQWNGAVVDLWTFGQGLIAKGAFDVLAVVNAIHMAIAFYGSDQQRPHQDYSPNAGMNYLAVSRGGWPERRRRWFEGCYGLRSPATSILFWRADTAAAGTPAQGAVRNPAMAASVVRLRALGAPTTLIAEMLGRDPSLIRGDIRAMGNQSNSAHGPGPGASVERVTGQPANGFAA